MPLPRVPRWQRPLCGAGVAAGVGCRCRSTCSTTRKLLLPTPLLRSRTVRRRFYDVHEASADFIAVRITCRRVALSAAVGVWLAGAVAGAHLESGLIFADDQIAQDFAEIDVPKTTLFNFPAVEFARAALLPSQGGPGRNRGAGVLYLGGMGRKRGSALMVEAFARARAA